VLGVLFAAACVAASLTACGAGARSSSTPPLASSTPPVTQSIGTASAGGTTPVQSPKRRAEADAAAILRSFAVPPGGRRLAQPPRVPGGLLTSPQSILGSTSAVDEATFWEAPGAPQAVLAWEQARLLPRFTLGDADFGPPSWDRGFELPPTGVLTDRELVVEVVGVGGGRTGIRVDAQVAWQPPRPPGDLVPPAARLVTIAEWPGPTARQHVPAPVTITDPAKVRGLVALIDGLPLSTFPAWASCPSPPGRGLSVTFRARPAGPALATAVTGRACAGAIPFTVNGKPGPNLTDGSPPNAAILAIAGLPWKLA
jgi:hypothetical protein